MANVDDAERAYGEALGTVADAMAMLEQVMAMLEDDTSEDGRIGYEAASDLRRELQRLYNAYQP